MATHSIILVWRIPRTEEHGGLQSIGSQRVGQLKELSMHAQDNQFSCSVMSDPLQPHGAAAHQASLSITNSQSLLKLMSIKSVMPSNHLICCCPLLLLPSIFPSIRVFSSESVLCIRWPKDWPPSAPASASVLPMNIQDWFPHQTVSYYLRKRACSHSFTFLMFFLMLLYYLLLLIDLQLHLRNETARSKCFLILIQPPTQTPKCLCIGERWTCRVLKWMLVFLYG